MRRYHLFRTQISEASHRLFQTYRHHLKCRRGCSYCCDPIAVVPLEREAIAQWAVSTGRRLRHQAQPDRCACLEPDGACGIYPARPVICRTFGLPLAYRTYEYDIHGREVRHEPPEYTDLWCDLNFTSIAPNQTESFFSHHGRLRMSDINERLDALNAAFLHRSGYRGQPEDQPLSAIRELTPHRKR